MKDERRICIHKHIARYSFKSNRFYFKWIVNIFKWPVWSSSHLRVGMSFISLSNNRVKWFRFGFFSLSLSLSVCFVWSKQQRHIVLIIFWPIALLNDSTKSRMQTIYLVKKGERTRKERKKKKHKNNNSNNKIILFWMRMRHYGINYVLFFLFFYFVEENVFLFLSFFLFRCHSFLSHSIWFGLVSLGLRFKVVKKTIINLNLN